MKTPSTVEREIQVQRRVIGRLKREIFGIDKTNKSRYIKEFMSEYRTFREIVSVERIIDEAARCDVVYFGDYHPLDASQDLVIRLMRELADRGRNVVLGLEMLYTHQQPLLDRWMKGAVSEEEFLESIAYESEWGFKWESYRRIFALAKDPFIPIFGIDEEPRDQLTFIRVRDRLIARRIANIRSFFPGYLVLVVIGESHLAATHLPAAVRRLSGERFREITIVQNIEAIYWRLLELGKEKAGGVRVGTSRYCVFNTSPILKYESYRNIIDAWIDGRTHERWTPALQEMVDNVLLFLRLDTRTLRIMINGQWRGTIEDAFPEVHCRRTYASFAALLRSKRASQLGTFASVEQLKQAGIAYVPAINSILVMRFDPAQALCEAARFVVHALRGRVGQGRCSGRTAEDRFYTFVMEEALLSFAAKLVNPTQDWMQSDPLLRTIDPLGVVRSTLPRLSLRDTRAVVSLLKYHFERDRRSRRSPRSSKRLEAIYRLGIKRRWMIVRTLGRTLGEAMHRAHRAGSVEIEELVALFRDRFEAPRSARACYLEWVRRVSPYRGHGGTHGGGSPGRS